MTLLAVVLFWASFAGMAYTYFLYPVLLWHAYLITQVRRDWAYLSGRRNRRARDLATNDLPSVSVVIAAHNEETQLPGKLANLREVDYPRDLLEVIFISDGSTDSTNDILSSQDGWKLLVLPTNRGKANALNVGIEQSRHEILVLCDAATRFAPDTIRKLVRRFENPRVGVVCGSLQFEGNSEYSGTEGVFWKYERLLRLMESRLGISLTASGTLYAVRRQSFRPLMPGELIDDFVVPMQARALGYQIEYDPEAIAVDFAAPSVEGEFVRRVRIAVGSFRSLGRMLRVPMDARTWWAFLSHKVLRWMVPFLLILMLASNVALWRVPFYRWLLLGQTVFYLWALLGFALRGRSRTFPLARFAYYLLAMNAAFVVGFLRIVFRRGQPKWQQAS